MTWCVLGDLRRRVTGWLGLGLISAGCAAAFGQTDGFPRKLEVGCGDEPSCQQLVTEANARVSRCQPNTVGYIRCDDARADLQIAQGLLHEARERRLAHEERQREEAARAQLAEEVKRQEQQMAEQRRREQLEARRQIAEAAEQTRAEMERLEQAEAIWQSIDVKKCSEQGHTPTCAALAEYVRVFPEASHVAEARVALASGREVAIRRDERSEHTTATRRPKSTPSLPAPKPKRARCCNGTIDTTCGCEGGAGCCFQKGGVCGCE